MPSMRFKVAATTTDALSDKKFRIVPPRGAILNVWGTGATAGDSFGLTIGDREIIVDGSPVNLEAANEVVDIDRDQLVVNEVIPGGQLYMPVTVTSDASFLMTLRYL